MGEYGEPWDIEECGYEWTQHARLAIGGERGIAVWGGTPESKADAARIVACVNALAGLNPAALGELIGAADEAFAHVIELEDAWQRGAISEHDGKGGTRSNRNVSTRHRLGLALAKLRGTGGGE